MKNKIWIGAGLLVLFALSAGLSHLFFWSDPEWDTNADSAATGVDEKGYPWFGAKNPKIVIHEYLDYECPHCPGAHRALRSAIAKHLNDVRLVRHDYARMPCAVQVGNELIKRCPMVRAAECASKHMPYWKWNDAVMSKPRPDTDLDVIEYINAKVKELKLPEEKFTECFDSDESSDKAQRFYEETKAAGVRSTPTYLIDGEVLSLRGVFDLLDEKGY